MPKRAVRYAVIDAFTDTPFKGNPAAVCFLEDGEAAYDDLWMQSVAVEFNFSATAFLARATPAAIPDSDCGGAAHSRFHLRWFTPAAEVELCGHATLATMHFLLTSGLVKSNVVEFVTKFGLLTAKKVLGPEQLPNSNFSCNETEEKFFIELDFPTIPIGGCDTTEIPSIPETLNGASIIDVQKTGGFGDLIVELSSGKEVADLSPNFVELEKCAGRGVIITGRAPSGSGFDYFSRFFCPKLGIYEDPVCGSAHCALAPYWSKKLGKQTLTAYSASPRSGRLQLEVEEKTQRVRIRGEAVTVMEGTILV